jgi:hypothetical protein
MKKHALFVFCVAALIVIAFISKPSAQVRINEFLANNVACNPDMCDYGDFSDWIELYNDGSAAADIGGYTMTGNLKNPKKATVPTGTSIPSKGYLLLWADGHTAKPGTTGKRPDDKGTSFTTKRYHIGFKCKKSGEQIGLFDASGKVVDSVTYGPQYADVSRGRTADGSWAYFDQPTPGAANSTAAKTSAQFSGTVSFSVPGGYYSSAQSITLTASDGSDIYYTTDGTIPYAGSAKKYSAAISAGANTVIRARCIASDKLAGKVATNTYFVSDKKRGVMVVNITTDPAFLNDATIGIFKNYYKFAAAPVYMEFFTPDGKLATKANARIQVGSLTNYGSAQKPLQVELFANNGDEYFNYKFFNKPITKFNKLRLRQGGDAWNSNFIADDLLDPISNGQMAYGYQAYCPVVQYINGKYYGLMDLREQFHGNYFEQNYGVDSTALNSKDEIRRLYAGASENWQVVSGSWSAMGSLMQPIKASPINYSSVTSTIDIDHMIDYVVIETYTCNISWGHNEDFWKVPNAKWRWLTTDIDRCFDYGGPNSMSNVNTDIIHTKGGGLSGSFMDQDTMFGKLMKGSTEFKNHFCQRYMAHLNSTLHPDRLNGIIDSIVGMLMPEMTDETSAWGKQGGIASVTAWKTEIGTMQDFCTERADIVRGHLAKDMTGGNAKLTVTVTDAPAGDIFIEGVKMCQGLSGLTFFKGAPLALKAVPKKGCTFKSWGGGATGTNAETSITLSGDQTVTATFEGKPEQAILSDPSIISKAHCPDKITLTNGNATIYAKVESPVADHIRIALFNVTGQKLATRESDIGPGIHEVSVTAHISAPGVYFYRIRSQAIDRLNKITIR